MAEIGNTKSPGNVSFPVTMRASGCAVIIRAAVLYSVHSAHANVHLDPAGQVAVVIGEGSSSIAALRDVQDRLRVANHASHLGMAVLGWSNHIPGFR